MKNAIKLLLAGVLVMQLACSNEAEQKAKALFEQASKVHHEAVEVHNAVMKDMSQLAELKTKLTEKQNAADSAQKQAIAQAITDLENVEGKMKEWMKNLVEVPGDEHHEHEGHNHEGHDHEGHEHHDHEAAKNLTPDQVLELQKEAKTNIEAIRQELANAVENAKKLL